MGNRISDTVYIISDCYINKLLVEDVLQRARNPDTWVSVANTSKYPPYSFYKLPWEEQVKAWKYSLVFHCDPAPYFDPFEPLYPYVAYGKWYDPAIQDPYEYKVVKRNLKQKIKRVKFRVAAKIVKERMQNEMEEFRAELLSQNRHNGLDYSYVRIPPIEFYNLSWNEQVKQWNDKYAKEEGYIQVLFSTMDPKAQYYKGRKLMPGPDYYKHEFISKHATVNNN
jgi:hypothetical protein